MSSIKVKLSGNFNEVPDSAPAPETLKLAIGKIANVDERDSNAGDPMVEVRWDIIKDANGKKLIDPKTKKAAAYDPVFTYHPLDPDNVHPMWARRTKELLAALGLKQNGTVDIKVGAEALLRLKAGEDQDGEYRPDVSKILKLGSTNGDEPEAEGDDEEEGEEEVDLGELDRDGLKAFIKENGLGIRVMKKNTDDEIREKIAEQMGGDDDEEDEEDEEEPEEEEDDSIDLGPMSRTELKALIKEHSLDVKVLKKDSDDDLRTKIAEAFGESAEEDDDEEDDGSDSYDENDDATLRKELSDRELSTKGKRPVLIKRLREDDLKDPV